MKRMPKAKFVSKLKKIGLSNKICKDRWQQAINVELGEIALNDENLLALRKFRPDEDIVVTIEAMQVNMLEEISCIKKENPTEGQIQKKEEGEEEEIFIEDQEVSLEEEESISVETCREEELATGIKQFSLG